MDLQISEIIERFRDAVKQSGLSYYDLEAKTSFSRSALQRYVSGETKKIPIDCIVEVANVVGVSASWILGWDSDKRNALSPSAQQLLNIYEDLNDEGQEKLIDYAEDLSASGRYIKTDPAGMVEEA